MSENILMSFVSEIGRGSWRKNWGHRPTLVSSIYQSPDKWCYISFRWSIWCEYKMKAFNLLIPYTGYTSKYSEFFNIKMLE